MILSNFKNQKSIWRGFGFGITSGVITTLGLMIGLDSGTHSKIVVINGVLVIAIADALSDSLAMHISEESQKNSASKDVWRATLSTFITKLIIASSFIIPVLLFPLPIAIIISVVYGLILISLLSYFGAKNNHEKPYKVVGEHLFIAIAVIIIAYCVGRFFSN